ncbi:hypothetical protein [Pantoea phage vB_PdeP_F1M1C]|nr:hypothetical protein [Pantoea phage vB_PdeP_F1M1C]URY11123.1 hypothetical protein [Shigella phage ESh12]
MRVNSNSLILKEFLKVTIRGLIESLCAQYA